MHPRAKTGGVKKSQPLGRLIRRQLDLLERLATELNSVPLTPEQREAQPLSPAPDASDQGWRTAREAAGRIIGRVAQLPPEQDPPHAVWVEWEALTVPNPFVYWSPTVLFPLDRRPLDLADPSTWPVYVSRSQLQEGGRRVAGGAWLRLRTPRRSGVIVALLAEYLNNPSRDRLRRCPICQQWFVDRTRNKFAQRCSRACTIAWSNARRDKNKKRNVR